MTDGLITVESGEDIAVSNPSDREQQGIATLLSAGAPGVVWVPEWVLEEKDLTTAKGYYRLAVGEVSRYSDKAYRIEQHDGTFEFLPVSEVSAFELGEDVQEVTTPQAGLADFDE